MKSYIFVIYFILLASASNGQSAPEDSISIGDKEKLNDISNRVNAGDYGALSDAAKLPAPAAVPNLYIWTMYNGNNHPEQYKAAIDALRKVQGSVPYLQKDIAAEEAKGRISTIDFDILSMIGTPEAQAALAPYLWDFKQIPPVPTGDTAPVDYCGEAMNALIGMVLPDRPVKDDNIKYSDALIAWQKWAIAKGFVPKDWSSRVGAPPSWLAEEAAYYRTSSNSTPAKSPTTLPRQTSPESPKNASPAVSSASPANIKTGASSRHLFALAISIAVICAIGCFIFLRRK